MSDAIYNQIQSAMAQVNDALTGVYGRDGQRLFLLKTGGNTKKLVSVAEVVSGYYVEWSNFREQMRFKLSTSNINYADLIAQTSYIGFGVPDVDSGEIDVFGISFDARDRIQPNAANPYWSLFATREIQFRYLP